MASRRILVTGGSGFVGQWLCRRLLDRGDMVFAGTIGQSTGPAVLTDAERASVTWLTLDTCKDGDIAQALERAAPEAVVHLAGIAYAPDATAAPSAAFEVNALGALRLLLGLAAAGARQTRVLVVGSAEQYGAHAPGDMPLTEAAEQKPLTVYAASKASQELLALQMARSSALRIVCARSFNHSGHGQNSRFLFPALVARAKRLPARGGQLQIGNGTPIRDYLHVADVAAAYDALLDKGQSGEVYNVSSGQGLSVRQVAERVLRGAGVEAEVVSVAEYMRPVDVPALVGDNGKLKATGWRAERSVDDIVSDLLHAETN